MKTPHLNDEQFTAYLLDAGSDPAGTAHLASCAICQEELKLFRQSVSSFNNVTLAWSESRPLAQIRKATPPSRAWSPTAAWALAACLMLVAALSVAWHNGQDRHSLASHPTNGSTHEENSEAEIARDNQLMTEVNLEINRQEPSPISEYGLSVTTGGPAKTRAEARIE
jgi:hypothetical protein